MLEGVGAVHMPCWMQTPTTRWLRGCVSSFNNRSLWVNCPMIGPSLSFMHQNFSNLSKKEVCMHLFERAQC